MALPVSLAQRLSVPMVAVPIVANGNHQTQLEKGKRRYA